MHDAGVQERGPRATATAGSAVRGGTLLTLAAYYAGIQLYLWWVLPLKSLAASVAGGTLILAVLVLDPLMRRERPGALGLGFGAFLPAARALLPGTLALAALTLALGWLAPDGGHGARFTTRLVNILPWALLQQTLLQTVFNRRLSRAFGPGWTAALLNGACFGLMHLPGLLLTAGTFGTGIWWSRVYQRRPNLWALILCHALLSALAQSCLPAVWTHGFRVGPGWFRWGP